MINFIRAYVKSMRLYYAFVTGMAGWVGLSYFQSTRGVEISAPYFLVLVFLFLSWGINQIVNDYLGVEEDKVNAPNRPMVTGVLNAKYALGLSILLIILMGITAICFFNLYALLPLVVGVVVNVIYEYAKGYGILGNLSFGFMLTMTTLFGALALSNDLSIITEPNFIALATLVFILNALLTYYTYFKDHDGDKAAGKKTLIVAMGPENAAKVGLVLPLITVVVLVILKYTNVLELPLNNTFYFLGGLALFLQLFNGYKFFRNYSGEKSYFALKMNFRSYAVGFTSLVALSDPAFSVKLFLVTYIFVGLFFDLHKDAKG